MLSLSCQRAICAHTLRRSLDTLVNYRFVIVSPAPLHCQCPYDSANNSWQYTTGAILTTSSLSPHLPPANSTTWPSRRCANAPELCRPRIGATKASSSRTTPLRANQQSVAATQPAPARWVANRTSSNTGAAQVVGPSPVTMLPRARRASPSCSSERYSPELKVIALDTQTDRLPR